jgi:hypothetical protein
VVWIHDVVADAELALNRFEFDVDALVVLDF